MERGEGGEEEGDGQGQHRTARLMPQLWLMRWWLGAIDGEGGGVTVCLAMGFGGQGGGGLPAH